MSYRLSILPRAQKELAQLPSGVYDRTKHTEKPPQPPARCKLFGGGRHAGLWRPLMPCPERVRTMRRRTLRAVAAVLLAAVLLPAALPAEEISFLPLTSGERSFASGLWDFLRAVFLGAETGSSATSGPDGATAACDNGWQIDPNGGDACVRSDNGWQIDPDG